MSKIKLGIIGIGNMGTVHLQNVIDGKCPEIEVTAVADTNPERLDYARTKLPETAGFFTDAVEMMDSGRIDSVLVAVPHYDHPGLSMAAFSRGLHVLTEKPAGVYTRDVREMNNAAEKSGVVFAMMFNQRTDHIYRKMRELVQSGEFGQIRRTSWLITNWYRPQAYYDSGAWRATWSGEGGGVLLNQCPHNLDLWQWICGMPVKINAYMSFGKWHDIEVEDDVSAYVEYENGATGVFVTSTGDFPGTNRFEITMDGAKFVAEDGVLKLWKLGKLEAEFSAENKEAFGNPGAEFSEVETDGRSEQHVGIMNAFASAILRGEPLIAGGEEGINGLTLSNAMHLSAWTNSEIILPLDEDLYYEELMKRVKTSRRKAEVKTIFVDNTGSYGGS